MCAVIVLVVTNRAAMATNSSSASSSSANPAGIASAVAYSTGTSIHLLNMCRHSYSLLFECISVLILSLSLVYYCWLVAIERDKENDRREREMKNKQQR